MNKKRHPPAAAPNFFKLTPSPATGPGVLLQQAVALHQRGQSSQAERLLRDLLIKDAQAFDALHMLALLRLQHKDHAEGLTLLDRALALKPGLAPVHNNRGIALRGLGRFHEALAAYDQALALQADYAEALNNRGNVLRDLGRSDAALDSFDHVLRLKPAHAQAHNNRGAVLRDLGRSDEALTAFAQALANKPDYAEALNNQGGALQDLGRPQEALASYTRALSLQPGNAEAFNNRGSALEELNRHAQALADYTQAIALRPDFAQALSNQGNALAELHRPDDALASYARALALQPDVPGVLANRASVLSHLKRHDEAAADYARVLQQAPNHPYALGDLINSRLQACDWTDHAQLLQQLETRSLAGEPVALPFTLVTVSANAQAQLQSARSFVAREWARPVAPQWAGERYSHERIRLAYLSADFHDHATAHLMIDLFEQHDRGRFEVTAISFGPQAPSAMRDRARAAFDHFVEARELGDFEVARMLREREIDVAIDLKGFTQDSRPGILAHRPAPVQVNYLGYPGSMGSAALVDYIVADATLITPQDEAQYAEQVVRLPHSYQVNSARADPLAETITRADAGLPEDAFVFCCFNNNYKITPAVFETWMQLLREMAGSVLWLLEDNPTAAERLRAAAARHDCAGRLVFAPRLPMARHLARQRLADLFLDTAPYNAHTTASDALWAGLPLLTCLGSTFAGRVAASLLRAIDLPELIAQDADDYRARALALARDPIALADLRERLWRQRTTHPLFDLRRSRLHLESAYRQMWEIAQQGLAPRGFSVTRLQT